MRRIVSIVAFGLCVNLPCTTMTLKMPEIRQEEVEEITSENFDEKVLKSSIPVVVKFTAPACPSCDESRSLDVEMANFYTKNMQTLQYPPRYPRTPTYDVRIFSVDMAQDKGKGDSLTTRYTISAAPTYLFFKGGKLIGRNMGAMDKPLYRKKIDGLLQNDV